MYSSAQVRWLCFALVSIFESSSITKALRKPPPPCNKDDIRDRRETTLKVMLSGRMRHRDNHPETQPHQSRLPWVTTWKPTDAGTGQGNGEVFTQNVTEEDADAGDDPNSELNYSASQDEGALLWLGRLRLSTLLDVEFHAKK